MCDGCSLIARSPPRQTKTVFYTVPKIVLHQQSKTEDGHLTNVGRKEAWKMPVCVGRKW